jgi:predicted enzyme related to lactoylglutathione lyase
VSSRARLDHGAVVYLQLPAGDIAASAEFYRRVFGWRVDPPDSGFEAPGLIGQWLTLSERPAAPEAGPLLWIFVDDIDDALALAAASGGVVVSAPEPDGPVRWLAQIHDPGGNLVGIAGHGRRQSPPEAGANYLQT